MTRMAVVAKGKLELRNVVDTEQNQYYGALPVPHLEPDEDYTYCEDGTVLIIKYTQGEQNGNES